MRQKRIVSTLLLVFTHIYLTYGQDFSNKGKDFWVGYGFHERMTAGGGGTQDMVLYFATEEPTTVRVEIPGNGYVQTYNIPANTIYTSNPLPKNGTQDARLHSEGVSNRGIHITSDKPIVAYAHVYNMSVSGATLLFPTNTLGREYYSVNYDQLSNTNNSNSWFYAVAVDPGVTTVEITPSQQTLNHQAGVPFTVDLQQGQVINIMGALSGQSGDLFRGVDLTGSRIRSVANASGGCKRLAVFSGSGRFALICDGVGTGQKSSDNYMVQAFPKTAWGKTYLTVPTDELSNNIFRIAVDDPATVVRLNGQILSPLRNNFYYEIGPLDRPAIIEADKPVMVAQYISTGRFCGNTRTGDLGDPEVIYLSPVEQTINRVILNSTPNYAIFQHHINVIIPSHGTAISSFRLDGMPYTSFTQHPQNPGYSYARIRVNQGQHILQSDSGFSAIAYGYGSFESYGYNAGSNVRDLYQFVTVDNELATVDFPAACKNAPFGLSMTFPYQPTSIEWKFNGLFPDVTDNNPVPSGTSQVNGRTLYKYSLPGTFSSSVPGTYPIRIIAQNPTADGCNGVQEIDYDLEIYDQPSASIDFASNGCVTSPVSLTGNVTNTGGRPLEAWYWDFGDGTINNSGSAVEHTYSGTGPFTIQYAVVTDIGCRSDTATRNIQLNLPPQAQFAVAAPNCAGKPIQFNDQSSTPAGTTIARWIWNFGDGSQIVTATNNAPQSHSFATPGNYTVTLQVETITGCLSPAFPQSVTIHPNPVVNFSLPEVCLPAGNAVFNSLSSISDGTESQFAYEWNFGDGSPAAGGGNPEHVYTSTGPFTISLQVTSGAGCISSLSQSLTTVFEEPQAAFTAVAAVCFGDQVNFMDQSSVPGSTIVQWQWDFGDGTASTERNPAKVYTSPGSYTVTLTVVSANGCHSVNRIATQVIEVLALPVAAFDLSPVVCAGRAVTFGDRSVANAGNIVRWNWGFGDNSSEVRNDAQPFAHVYQNTGSFTASLQVETDRGCTSSVSSVLVQVNPNPLAAFEAPVICVNDVSAPFSDASTIVNGTVNNWEWNFGDVNAGVANPNIATGANVTHHYTAPGTYTATLIATSTEGCRDTTQRTFTVNGAVLTPSFVADNGNTVCSNTELRLRDDSRVDAGRIIRVVIQWDPADPASITTDDSPFPGKIYTHRYPVFSSPASQTYRVRCLVYSGISCVEEFEQQITVLASPQPVLAGVPAVCSNAAQFSLSVQSPGDPGGVGIFSGPGTSVAGVFDPAAAGAGSHHVQYTITANNGCTGSAEQTIIVHPTPVADAGPDKVVLEGGQVALTPALITAYPVTYAWTPSAGLSDTSVASPLASPATDFTYQLTVTSDQGCSSSDIVFVKLLLAPVIPNIFSPNGDGINDRWEIRHLETYPGCVIQLYNRYGQMVHRIVNYTTPWDGRINGRDAPIGTYYYVIDPRNGRKPIAGYVDIIR